MSPFDPNFNTTVNSTGVNQRSADPDGSDSGSGDVYISPIIYDEDEPKVACIPPCTLIFPPVPLDSTTTITFPPYTTSLEVAWSAEEVVTIDGSISTSRGLEKNDSEHDAHDSPG